MGGTGMQRRAFQSNNIANKFEKESFARYETIKHSTGLWIHQLVNP